MVNYIHLITVCCVCMYNYMYIVYNMHAEINVEGSSFILCIGGLYRMLKLYVVLSVVLCCTCTCNCTVLYRTVLYCVY